MKRLVPTILSAVLLVPSLALADAVYIKGTPRNDAVIRELRGDTLVFEFNGRPIEAPVASITRLVVNGEGPLTEAEDAYALGKWDEAVDNYLKTIRTTTKQWIKDWSAMRLVDAANKSGRFDAAASAYVLTLLKDPAAAAKLKPTMPDAKSTYLDTAVADVQKALGDTKLSVDQRRALLGFMIELQQARKDKNGENAAFEQLAKLPGADVNDPAAKRVLIGRRIAVAQQLLDAKNYQQAIAEIANSRAIFTDPTQQADALWIVAEARYGLAGTDPAALKDAGLSYMRVVALAKDEPGRPHVVLSLLRTATIMEQLGEPQTASQICEQVLSQYPDDPASIRAKENLERLKKQASAASN
jgi:TolA-binding protein